MIFKIKLNIHFNTFSSIRTSDKIKINNSFKQSFSILYTYINILEDIEN